jgi:hypothetical protein
MKRLVAVASLSLLASGSVRAGQASQAVDVPKIVITRSGTRPSRPAPAENFTGSVRVERLFEAAGPPHAGDASVTFEPGAETLARGVASDGDEHIAVTEPLGGKTADWMEKVSDAEYGASVAPRGSDGQEQMAEVDR